MDLPGLALSAAAIDRHSVVEHQAVDAVCKSWQWAEENQLAVVP
jgi:hypothetical protein